MTVSDSYDRQEGSDGFGRVHCKRMEEEDNGWKCIASVMALLRKATGVRLCQAMRIDDGLLFRGCGYR